jgi:hypothetical protein
MTAACVVFPYGPYWKPEAAGGRYIQGWCQGRAGPYARVALSLADGLGAELRVEEKPQRIVFVTFQRDASKGPLQFAPTQRIAFGGTTREVPTVLRRAQSRDGKLDFNYGGDLSVGTDETRGIALEVRCRTRSAMSSRTSCRA